MRAQSKEVGYRGCRLRWLVPAALAGLCVGGTAEAAVPPARRQLAEVKAALAKAPKPPASRELRPLTVLLVANRKDHGPHEHDYPRWMARWKVLLGGKAAGSEPPTMYGLASDLPVGPSAGAPKVTVETAADWPSQEQLQRADVVVAFMGTGGIWNEAKLRDLRSLLDRGKGFVALHAAVIAEKPHARPLAELLGLAWEGGTTLFRHGPLDLKITAPDHPITRGLPERIHFEDETYWPLVGDSARVQVLATADEPARETGKLTPQPMFWTHTVGKGRVFNSILGHYSWTFDDPYFRALVLRGTAWAAGESPYRFDPLVLAGARVTDRGPAAAQEAQNDASAPPVAPDPNDPNLLLWLDASDRTTLTTAADGRVAAWTSKATRVPSRLSSTGTRQPAYATQALGGKPAVRFDGEDDILRDTSFRQAAKNWTIAMVVTPRSNAGFFRALMAANRPGQDDFQTGFNIDLGSGASPTFNSVNLEGIKGGGATNLRTATVPFGGGQVLVLSTGSGGSRLWVNGQQEEGRGASDAVTAMEELRLGGRFFMGQERGFFHGDVSEVLIYRGQLSDTHRAGLTAHLMKKYGPDIQPPASVALDPWDYLPSYDWGGTRRPLVPIDEEVARAKRDPRLRKALETRLAEVAADPANTPASRDFACRRLAVVGSSASVPALARLLGDPVLTTMACFALERIPGPEAERALLEALPRQSGRQRLEVIGALGGRRSRAAVPELNQLLRDTDAGVRGAAVSALGNIGGPEGVTALTASLAQAQAAEQTALTGALLKSAERYAEEGRGGDAEAVYARLQAADMPPYARRAAVRAVILAQGASAAPLLVEQLNSSDPRSRTMALLLIRENSSLVPVVASRLTSLSPEAQARVLTVLADRRDPAAAASVRMATRSENAEVRVAAIQALGRVGNESDVPGLLTAAAAQDRELAAAAAASLASLSTGGVDTALLVRLEQGSPAERSAAAAALGRRGHAPAAPALIRAARGTEPALRLAAVRALGEAGTVAETPVLVELLVRTKEPREAQAAEQALTTLHTRTGEKERWAEALLAGLGGAGSEAKAALLRALSQHGGPKALQAVRAAVTDPDTDLQDEALGLLADWETPDAADALLQIAKSSANRTHRTLALRGYLRMAGLPAVQPAQRLEMSQEGLRLAQRDDERKLALAALAGVGTVEALRAVLRFIEREGLSDEAGAATVAIAQKLLPQHADAVRDALDRVLKAVKNPEVVRLATELRARVQR